MTYPLAYAHGFLADLHAFFANTGRVLFHESYPWWFWICATDAPLIGPQIVAALWWGFGNVNRLRNVVCYLALYTLTILLIFAYPWHYYYALIFSPVMLVFIMDGASRCRTRFWRWVNVGLVVAPGIGLVRTFIVFLFFLHSGVSLAKAQSAFKTMDSILHYPLYASTNIGWAIADGCSRVQFGPKDADRRYQLEQQTYRSYEPMEGERPNLFGLPIARWPQGYAFYVGRPDGD
jgi:hypothetical protein